MEDGRCKDEVEFDFHEWMEERDSNLNQFLHVGRVVEGDCEKQIKSLVAEAMHHYQAYYDAKARLAQTNVTTLFNPTWLSAKATCPSWVTGWRPSVLFRLVRCLDLSDDQKHQVEKMSEEVEEVIKELDRRMADVQGKAVSGLAVVIQSGEGREKVMSKFSKEVMEVVVAADELRMNTLRRITNILKPLQAVDFLVAAAKGPVNMHGYGPGDADG